MKHQRPDYMRFQEPAPLIETIRELKQRVDFIGPDPLEQKANELLAFYDAIPAPTHPIGEDEPVFLLRAKDQFALKIVDFYRDLCREQKLPQTTALIGLYNDIAYWQDKHGSKLPDQPSLFEDA